jgi:hypothetical protein
MITLEGAGISSRRPAALHVSLDASLAAPELLTSTATAAAMMFYEEASCATHAPIPQPCKNHSYKHAVSSKAQLQTAGACSAGKPWHWVTP